MQQAYEIWKPSASYSFDGFLKEDWGPDGYYGPVKSYHVKEAYRCRTEARSAAEIVRWTSARTHRFPTETMMKQSKSKEVRAVGAI